MAAAGGRRLCRCDGRREPHVLRLRAAMLRHLARSEGDGAELGGEQKWAGGEREAAGLGAGGHSCTAQGTPPGFSYAPGWWGGQLSPPRATPLLCEAHVSFPDPPGSRHAGSTHVLEGGVYSGKRDS